MVADADGMISIWKAPGVLQDGLKGHIKVAGTFENAKTILSGVTDDINMKHLVTAFETTPVGKTGVTWYDNLIDKAKATTYNDIANYFRGKAGMKPVQIEQAAKVASDKNLKMWNFINSPKKVAAKAAVPPMNDRLDNLTFFIIIHL